MIIQSKKKKKKKKIKKKNKKNNKKKKKKDLEITLKELFKNNYWCDKGYEFEKYLKFDDNFILNNVNISNLFFYSIEYTTFNIVL